MTIEWPFDVSLSPSLFLPVQKGLETLTQSSGKKWPTLDIYNQHPQTKIENHKGKEIIFVSQSDSFDTFEQQYEPRIYLSGEVQTRLENWHDLFQVLVWNIFPKTKAKLNALHYQQSIERKETQANNRDPLENAITLFDECGAVLLSDRIELLDLVRNFQWKELFWNRRQELTEHFRCYVFGHAMYEKALTPYVGMTSHCVLMETSSEILSLSLSEQLTQIDTRLSNEYWDTQIQSPRDLQPFPLLGMPEWFAGNEEESFYDNKDYFRSGRRSRQK
ncbi:MAG: DUF3025 domain-containing protein [Gammaproteobacteria bacterium]|nr:DUF3025 domain-containing protein [Gammaproteobacteria bacterium]MDH5693692.1 DUF3025 domain-containing protein [Gammaproteobacteria bacterium]